MNHPRTSSHEVTLINHAHAGEYLHGPFLFVNANRGLPHANEATPDYSTSLIIV